MSCCGCASRVLKLRSEVKSWKNKLGDEKREKKMILKWIMAAFGYDVQVFIEKDTTSKTHGIRLQATENKEAMAKALIKLGGIGGTEIGTMLMEQKLEDHEFYEPWEEPYDAPEFPILEINSMPTQTQQQAPIVNTGISSFGHLSQQHNAPTLSITSPLEVKSTPLPINNTASGQEVMYIAGGFEEPTTIQGHNGQSYIIVRANEGEDVPVPVHMDYSNCIVKEEVITTDDNLYFPTAIPSLSETANVNYLTTATIPAVQSTIPTITLPNIPTEFTLEPTPNVLTSGEGPIVLSSTSKVQTPKSANKRKSSLSPTSQSGGKANKKQKPSAESSSRVKNMNGTPVFAAQSNGKQKFFQSEASSSKMKQEKSGNGLSNIPNEGSEIGLTLREKAEIYVLQKAKQAIEKVGNGFRCTMCDENRYVYSTFEAAVAHTKTHYESKPYKCELCDESFALQREISNHKKTAHPKSKVVPGSFSSRLSPSQSKPFIKNKMQSATGEPNLNETNVNIIATLPSPSTSNFQTKTIMVQAPFDNNLLKGPITVTSDVLAALLRSNSAVIVSAPGVVSQGSVQL